MNSEKVKEIKKGLECCKQNEIEDTCKYCLDCPASNWDYEKECKIDLFQKTITLINELESENAKLLEENESLNGSWKNAIKRIAELEKEVETRKEEVLHLQEYGKKLIRETELKQFAEKLKEKALSHCRTINCYELTFIETTIDELLKEYENDTI